MVPLAYLLLLVAINVYPAAVLEAVHPAAQILSTVWPKKLAFALLLVVRIASLVASPVGPAEYTIAVHLVSDPLANELAPVAPPIRSVTLDTVFVELAFIL